jgi:endogenous inhibitor of DNA gyrase (YacG/DUF329 family)
MSQLVKCTSCARHVRLSETSCPFCAAPLDVGERAASAQAVAAGLPSRRMSRAALLAIGLGVIAPITSACSSDDSTDNGDDAGHDGSVTPAYGLPGDASIDAMVSVLYGAPVTDASFALDGTGAPAYGAFPGDAAMAVDAHEEPDGSDAGDAGDAQH